MAEQLGTAVLELRADGSKLKGDIEAERRTAIDTVDQMGRSMQKVGLGMTAAVTGPVLALGGKAVDAASDLNESINAVQVVFGDASDKILEFGETAAETAGLSKRAFNELVTPIGAMLQNVGFSADEAAESSVNLAQRAADMASVFNTDVSEALGAIQAGLRGEADPLEQFGVGLSAASVEAHGLSMGLAEATVDMQKVEAAQLKVERSAEGLAKARAEHGESSLEAREAMLKLEDAQRKVSDALEGQTVELTDQQKAQARLSLLMKQSDAIAGDYINTKDSLANSERSTGAAAENAAASFGQHLLPVKQQLVSVVADLVDRFSKLSPEQQEMIVKVGMLAAAVGPLLIALGSVVRGVAAVSSAVTTIGPKLLALGTKVQATAVKVVTSAAQMAASMARATAQAVASAVRWAATTVAQGAKAAASMAVTAAKFVAHYAKMALASTINAAKMAASWVIAMGPVGWVIAGIVALVALIIANWDKVKEWTKRIWTWVSEKVSGVWRAVVGFVTDGVAAVLKFHRELPGKIMDAIKSLATTVLRFIEKYHPAAIIARKAVELWPTIREWFTALPGRILDMVSGFRTLLVDVGRDLIRGLIDGVTGMVGNAVDAVTDVAGGIVDGVKGFLRIGSPSKVFADEVGAPMMEGTYVGFQRAGRRLSGPMGDALSPSRFTSAMAAGGSAGHTHPIYLDSQEVSETLGPVMVGQIRSRTGL